jgi:hypothetical protein
MDPKKTEYTHFVFDELESFNIYDIVKILAITLHDMRSPMPGQLMSIRYCLVRLRLPRYAYHLRSARDGDEIQAGIG